MVKQFLEKKKVTVIRPHDRKGRKQENEKEEKVREMGN